MTPVNPLTRQASLKTDSDSIKANQPINTNYTPAEPAYPRYPSPANVLSACPHCCHLDKINPSMVFNEQDGMLQKTAIKNPTNLHIIVKDYIETAFKAHQRSKELLLHPDIIIWHFTLHKIHIALKNMPTNSYHDHGTGVATRIDQAHGMQIEYCGDFVNWKKTGYGVEKKIVQQDEKNNTTPKQTLIEEYQGDFLNNKRHGVGNLIKANHFRYTGGFKENQLHALGLLSNENDEQYEGEFLNDLPHGKGTLLYANGSKYKGCFAENHPHGKGLLQYNDGNQYEGDFYNGIPQGKGTLTVVDGQKFEGEFKNGFFHG